MRVARQLDEVARCGGGSLAPGAEVGRDQIGGAVGRGRRAINARDLRGVRLASQQGIQRRELHRRGIRHPEQAPLRGQRHFGRIGLHDERAARGLHEGEVGRAGAPAQLNGLRAHGHQHEPKRETRNEATHVQDPPLLKQAGALAETAGGEYGEGGGSLEASGGWAEHVGELTPGAGVADGTAGWTRVGRR